MLTLVLLAVLAAQDPAPTVEERPAFDAHVVPSKDLGFWDEWSHSVSAHGPKLARAGTVVRGQAWEIFPFARAYAIGEDGGVDLRYDLRITRPDGKPYTEKKGLELFVQDGQKAVGVQLAREAVGVSFDPPDALGTYRIEVVVHDTVAKLEARAEAQIELVAYPAPRAFEGEEDLGEWLTSYHHDPEPVRALDAIATVGKLGWYVDEQKNGPVRTFLREVFAENKFLEPLLLAAMPKLDAPGRMAAFDVLAGAGWEPKEFLAKATEEEREFYAARVKTRRPDPLQGPIRDAMQLDELWAVYFAHGRFAPIERLARSLALDEQDQDAAGGELMTGVLEKTAAWSLGSNLEHPRVRAFCEWMVERKVLDAADAARLQALLEE